MINRFIGCGRNVCFGLIYVSLALGCFFYCLYMQVDDVLTLLLVVDAWIFGVGWYWCLAIYGFVVFWCWLNIIFLF